MGNAIIGHTLIGDLATIHASSEAPSMPAAYLKKAQPTDNYRATTISPHVRVECSIAAAMAAAEVTSWNTALLAYTNAGSTGTRRVTGAFSQGGLWSGAPVDTGHQLHWTRNDLSKLGLARTHMRPYFSATPRTETWVGFEIIDPVPRVRPEEVSAPYYDAGKLIIAQAYQPALNIQKSPIRSPEQAVDEVRAFSGPRFVRETPRYDGWTVTFQATGPNAAEVLDVNLETILRWRGFSKPVFVLIDPDNMAMFHANFLYGTIASVTDRSVPDFGLHEFVVTIKELP